MRYALRVYEIEHSADRDAALAGIARAGAQILNVVSDSSYGHDCADDDSDSDSIAVLVEFPGSRDELRAALEREEVCL